jgi:hypothetical protein
MVVALDTATFRADQGDELRDARDDWEKEKAGRHDHRIGAINHRF